MFYPDKKNKTIRKVTNLIIIATVTLFTLTKCANKVAPVGGDKDIKGPDIVVTNPTNKSLQFAGKTLELRFDEFVKLQNEQDEIIISPPPTEKPSFVLRGKTLQIKFKEPLQTNTTYTITMGDAVKDITENNPAAKSIFSFSTGSTLDTLFLAGTVKKTPSAEPADKTFVGLYPYDADSNFTKRPPLYLARTDAKGKYLLQGIAPGKYRLVAFSDQNFNLYFDLPNEQIAFATDAVTPDTTQKNIPNLNLFSEGFNTPKVMTKGSNIFGRLDLVYDQRVDTLDITPLYWQPNKGDFLVLKNTTLDTINIWYRNLPKNTDSLIIVAKGSNNYQDTIKFLTLPGLEDLDDINFTGNISGRGVGVITPYQTINLLFNHPIERYDSTKIQLLENDKPIDLTGKLYLNPNNPKRFSINYPAKPDHTYELIFLKESLTDFFNILIPEIKRPFKVNPENFYGNLQVNLSNYNPDYNYIATLKSNNKILTEQVVTNGKWVVNWLKPGNLQIIVTEDRNKNNRWTTGFWRTKTQPERTFSTPQPTVIQANWDTEVTIDVQ